ncbi:hypothetical protein LTR02_013885 [Friedmanniomyces endolithicus]|nr:hypothetical protein LTR02_013885 [Friedmanniomyces endolithicus]
MDKHDLSLNQSAYTTVPADADADANPAHQPSPPSEQRNRDDDNSTASSRTLPVDEREGVGGGSADYERLGSGSTAEEGEAEEGEDGEEEDMGPPRRRRDAFGASCVSDLDLDSVYEAPTDEELGGGDADAGVGGEGEGVGAGVLAGANEDTSAGPGGGVGGETVEGRNTGLSVLDTVRQFRSLDYTSGSGSSGAAAAAPHAMHRPDALDPDTEARNETNEGIRGFRTRLRHQPGVANFLRPLDNNPADRSQGLNLDGGVATPDAATLAEVNGSGSDDGDRAPLSLHRTRSSKYGYKGKGKEAVYYDPQDMDRNSIASSTADAEPRRERREREPGEPFGHQPESSRDAVATPPADDPTPIPLQRSPQRSPTIAPQPQPSPDSFSDPDPDGPDPESISRPIRAGPRDGRATDRDPGHWSLAPREDATTNTAAEEATRMTVEWLGRSDAEGTSPVDRLEGSTGRQDWEVGLRGPLP